MRGPNNNQNPIQRLEHSRSVERNGVRIAPLQKVPKASSLQVSLRHRKREADIRPATIMRLLCGTIQTLTVPNLRFG